MAARDTALAAADFIHQPTVDRDALTSLSTWPMLPNCRALVRAACSSPWTGTIRALLPFPCLTRIVGRSVSSDRSRVSISSASDTLSPTFHWTSIGSWFLGFGAARTSAFTSCISMYSGSGFETFSGTPRLRVLDPGPADARGEDGGLIGGHGGVSGVLSCVQDTFSERLSRIRTRLSGLRGGVSYGGVGRMQPFAHFVAEDLEPATGPAARAD